jgi:hypothetical protein
MVQTVRRSDGLILITTLKGGTPWKKRCGSSRFSPKIGVFNSLQTMFIYAIEIPEGITEMAAPRRSRRSGVEAGGRGPRIHLTTVFGDPETKVPDIRAVLTGATQNTGADLGRRRAFNGRAHGSPGSALRMASTACQRSRRGSRTRWKRSGSAARTGPLRRTSRWRALNISVRATGGLGPSKASGTSGFPGSPWTV